MKQAVTWAATRGVEDRPDVRSTEESVAYVPTRGSTLLRGVVGVGLEVWFPLPEMAGRYFLVGAEVREGTWWRRTTGSVV